MKCALKMETASR